MAFITKKIINGQIYYYLEKREWKDGKSRRQWQKYLGTAENIGSAVDGYNLTPEYAVLLELGSVSAYWNIAQEINLIGEIDAMFPKRDQGMSVGEYMQIAAINRGIDAVSKRSMWEWFETTILLNKFPHINKEALSSQRFWDNMNLIEDKDISQAWDNIIHRVIEKHKIDLSLISYDGTNYYSFIGSFNENCSLAQRGKNKQGRKDLRQINYALFCSREDHVPLYFDVYEGNTHDSKEFNKIIGRFKETFKGKIKQDSRITIIFDKGNNSPENIAELDQSEFNFVGSVKLDEHKDLSQISNSDKRFLTLKGQHLEKIKAYRTKKSIYEKDRTVVVTFNNNLYTSQVRTINIETTKCMKELEEVRQNLQDRADGLIKKGRKPTLAGVKNKVAEILQRQYMKRLITVEIEEKNQTPVISYKMDAQEFAILCDTYLGKKIIFTDNHHWKTEDIIDAYHNQYVVEDAFKETKDRHFGSWWPMFHYTDQKIKVHGFYCSIALLLSSLIKRKTRLAGMDISMNRIHDKLNSIKQVINYYPADKKKSKGKGKKKMKSNTTITKMDEIQTKLFDIMGMKKILII